MEFIIYAITLILADTSISHLFGFFTFLALVFRIIRDLLEIIHIINPQEK